MFAFVHSFVARPGRRKTQTKKITRILEIEAQPGFWKKEIHGRSNTGASSRRSTTPLILDFPMSGHASAAAGFLPPTT